MWIILWKILWKFTSGTLRYDHCMLPPSIDQYPNQYTVQGIDQIRIDKVVYISCADFRHLLWPSLNETQNRPVIVAQATSAQYWRIQKLVSYEISEFSQKNTRRTTTKTLQSKPDHQTSNGSDFVRRLSGKKIESKGRWIGTSTKHWQARNNS